MKIKIGNRVFQGEGVELARRVVTHRIPNNAKTFAIIGEDDQGDKCFFAAVDADELPMALNELWDMLQPEEGPFDESLSELISLLTKELEDLFNS